MRFMIGVDLEGVACVVGEPLRTLTDAKDYAWACKQATLEADAAARALWDAGAEEVIVWDNHGGGLNLLPDLLDSRCDLVIGSGAPRGRWPGIGDACTGVLLVGYHAMDNTPNAILAHTFSSVSLQGVRVNEAPWGEIAIDAAFAAEHGAPVLFVSSDQAGVREAQAFLPWAGTVITKEGYGVHVARCKHPRRVVEEIYDTVTRSVHRLHEMQCFHAPSPISLELHFKRMEETQSAVQAGALYVDAYTVRRTLQSLSEWV